VLSTVVNTPVSTSSTFDDRNAHARARQIFLCHGTSKLLRQLRRYRKVRSRPPNEAIKVRINKASQSDFGANSYGVSRRVSILVDKFLVEEISRRSAQSIQRSTWYDPRKPVKIDEPVIIFKVPEPRSAQRTNRVNHKCGNDPIVRTAKTNPPRPHLRQAWSLGGSRSWTCQDESQHLDFSTGPACCLAT
jgi:hypothetical protein